MKDHSERKSTGYEEMVCLYHRDRAISTEDWKCRILEWNIRAHTFVRLSAIRQILLVHRLPSIFKWIPVSSCHFRHYSLNTLAISLTNLFWTMPRIETDGIKLTTLCSVARCTTKTSNYVTYEIFNCNK